MVSWYPNVQDATIVATITRFLRYFQPISFYQSFLIKKLLFLLRIKKRFELTKFNTAKDNVSHEKPYDWKRRNKVEYLNVFASHKDKFEAIDWICNKEAIIVLFL